MRTKSEARRQAILDVASQVFLEMGFEHASMTEISARVGGSKATLYNYFSSKEEIFVETVRQTAERDALKVFELLDPAADLAETLFVFGKQLVRFVLSPELLAVRRLVYGTVGQNRIGPDFYERGPKRGEDIMQAYLDKVLARGALRPCDTRVATLQLLALIESPFLERGLLRVQEDIDEAELEHYMDAAVRVFIAAYGPPAAKG